jgi:hypothetical protein
MQTNKKQGIKNRVGEMGEINRGCGTMKQGFGCGVGVAFSIKTGNGAPSVRGEPRPLHQQRKEERQEEKNRIG